MRLIPKNRGSRNVFANLLPLKKHNTMRLLKIGRDASCDIVLHSDKVSSLHAELTLLNNGDITIEDKGSHNGTFIMNQPIKAGKQVKVRRGDAIRFADVELQWSQVPMPEDNSAYRAIFGIGSHFNNDLQISGATVSRYHATVKQGKDGKMYIFDHSKNGTTVNGQKIQSNTQVRIKKSDAVVCGGVPVDLSTLPWPSSAWKTVLGIAAAVLVIVGVGFGATKIIPNGKTLDTEAINDRYSNSVVMLVGLFHYEVTADGLSDEDFKKLGFPTQFVFININGTEVPVNKDVLTEQQFYQYCTYTGTGFFISDDGQLITNLHIIKPWLFDDRITIMENWYREQFAKIAETRAAILASMGITPEGLSAYISQIKVKGVSDGVLLVPQGKFFSSENAVKCTVLSAGEDINKDVALIQSDKMELPTKHSTFINVKDSLDDSEEALKVGKTMFTIGFPHGLSIQSSKSEKGIQVFCHTGHISQNSEEYKFNFDAVSAGGASGSPIFNDKGMLIGVLNSGIKQENFNGGIKAKYVKELLESPHTK